MYSTCISTWAGLWTGVVIVARRTSVVWILLRSLLLRLDRLDMLVSGAGLVMGKAVSAFCVGLWLRLGVPQIA